ncbi:MAG: hybrid sensor histidine kinase/response regulator [Sulfurimonas sp.]|nr:hybrid sensor histidine kinase/response regulator [Sulfurimonas sp.]
MQENNSFTDKSILIIDDNKTDMLLLKSILVEEGYKSIYTAESAKEAYQILETNMITAILLDVSMPEIDGIEACQTIRKIYRHKTTPIIMITADSSDETLKRSFDAGANDFVTKPINLVNLNSRIKNIILHKEKDKMIQDQISSAAVNEIIEVITHQWKQPLADISKRVLKIKDAYQLGKIDKYIFEENIDKIDKDAHELSKAIDEVKTLSNIDKKTSTVAINILVKYALNIIKKSYKNRKISLQMKEDENLKKILMLPNEFVRVLLNILINSQEAFLQNKNKQTKTVQIIISQDDIYTKIVIRDNAGGINDENISKIFNPFFTTKNKKNSTGLGLYYCKQIIEQHQGGKLSIYSNNNITEVSIKLLNHNPYMESFSGEKN